MAFSNCRGQLSIVKIIFCFPELNEGRITVKFIQSTKRSWGARPNIEKTTLHLLFLQISARHCLVDKQTKKLTNKQTNKVETLAFGLPEWKGGLEQPLKALGWF